MRSVVFAAGLLLLAVASSGAAGQERPTSTQDLVADRQFAYGAAKERHQADSAQAQLIRHEWDRLIEQLGAARERGEDELARSLMGTLQELTDEKTRTEYDQTESREAWIRAGKDLINALNSYLQLLSGQIRSSAVGSDDEANSLYNEYEERLEEVEAELPEDEPDFEPMPEVEILPQDGPREIRHKLSLLENRERHYVRLLAELDREIEALELRQIRERWRRDEEARRDIFDTDVNPTGRDRTNVTDAAGIADTTAVLPLEDRIDRKKKFRERVDTELKKLEDKVSEFRRELGRR